MQRPLDDPSSSSSSSFSSSSASVRQGFARGTADNTDTTSDGISSSFTNCSAGATCPEAEQRAVAERVRRLVMGGPWFLSAQAPGPGVYADDDDESWGSTPGSADVGDLGIDMPQTQTQTNVAPADHLAESTIAGRVIRNKRKASLKVQIFPESDSDDDFEYQIISWPSKKPKPTIVLPKLHEALSKHYVDLRIPLDPPAPEIIDLTGAHGVPQEADEVVWCGQYKTKLPWIPKLGSHRKGTGEKGPKRRNRLQSLARHVQALAEKAKPASDCSWIVELDYALYRSDQEFAHHVRYEIGKGNVVVVKGYPSLAPAVELDTGEIFQRLGIVPDCEVVIHDSCERQKNMSEPFVPCPQTLEDFCKRVDDDGYIQCILQTFTAAHGLDFFPLINDAYLPHTQQTVFADAKRLQGWAWFHHALYYSFPHFSGPGFGTCALVRSGCQFWIVARYPGFEEVLERSLRDYGAKDEEKRRRMFEWLMGFARFEPKGDEAEGNERGGSWFEQDYERFLVVLQPGDIIIQPPFTLHEIYIPVPSVTTGGDFYCCETMRLTEIALRFNVYSEGFLSDAGPMAFMPAIYNVRGSQSRHVAAEDDEGKRAKRSFLIPLYLRTSLLLKGDPHTSFWREKRKEHWLDGITALYEIPAAFEAYDDSGQFPGKDQGYLRWLQTTGAKLDALGRRGEPGESGS